MKNFFKGKIATAIILLATFVLAGVAIFTAIRLYQLRQAPVAPNVPSSVPKATGVAACGQACNLSVNPAVNCPTGYSCLHTSNLAGANGVCRNTNCTDKTDCTCTTSSCSLSFSLNGSSPTPTATATSTSNPTATPTATATSRSTPTPTATATSTATATPTTTATATPLPQCNNTCSQNSNCPTNLICYVASGASTGNCRNSSCTGESSCTCATATPTSTSTPTITHVPTSTATATSQPALPQSGTDWPTIFGIGIGVLTIIGSLLLAL